MAISTRCPTDHHGPLIPPIACQDPAAPLGNETLEAGIRELVILQQDHWLSVITDGELARGSNEPTRWRRPDG